MAITMSEVFEPCTLMLYWPSTNGVTVVPGSSSARAGVLRMGVGIESRMSRLATNCVRLLVTSTVGVAPVTVTDSSSAPTFEPDVDLCAERAFKDHVLAPHRLETGERERHLVASGAEVNDPVLAGPVGDHAARFLDQRRAGGFNLLPGRTAPEPSRTTPAIEAWALAAREVISTAAQRMAAQRTTRRMASSPLRLDQRVPRD